MSYDSGKLKIERRAHDQHSKQIHHSVFHNKGELVRSVFRTSESGQIAFDDSLLLSENKTKPLANKTNYDLMRATFPAGTVSGAPKIRAMQIIADLEDTTRGPYGGCVGYFSFNGNLDTCITIRTALLKDGKAYVQAGGGWVNDSEPEAEFQETVNKSKAMLKAVALAETFNR